MASQDSVAYQTLTELRTREIKDSSSFRWIMLVTNFLCKFPNPSARRSSPQDTNGILFFHLAYCTLTLSPPLVFGVYVGTASSGYDFSVSKIFTSLVIVTLLSSPLVRLFQVLPQLGGAYGCFQRLHKFLLLEEKYDHREIRLTEKPEAGDPDPLAARTEIIALRDLSLGWNDESNPILTNINLRVNKGAKIAIIGSVGTGKTLLLKGLIGEAHSTHGQLILAPSASLAYCSQTAWLENLSAKEIMTQHGREPSGSTFYRQLAFDCVLDDLIGLPTFASASIGSGGVKLSGGQRQRLVSLHTLSMTLIGLARLLTCLCV